MILCKSQEDLLSYQFHFTAERDLITSKTLAEHGGSGKKSPGVMLGENEKVGLMPGVPWLIGEPVPTGTLKTMCK